MTKNIKSFMLGGGFLVTLVGWILSLVGLFKKIDNVGSLFDSSKWSDSSIPSKVSSHRSAIFGTGFIGLIIGIILLVLIAFYLYKVFKDNLDIDTKFLIPILIASGLVMIMGIIAIVFNSHLNDPAWLAKVFKDSMPDPRNMLPDFNDNELVSSKNIF